jgi:CRP-like cAMP-binding protein
MSNEVLDILTESKLFSGFTQDQLEEVILHMNPKPVILKNGERVYKKGDTADRCWLIVSGKLILKRSSLRSPFRHMIYNKGSVTGIQGLVDSGSTRVASMIADGKVELVEITHEGIAHLNRDTQTVLWENVSKLLLRKLSICLSRETFDD